MTSTEITLAEYYNQFHKMVYNTALSYLQNIEDAEEITQDVFLELHQEFEKKRLCFKMSKKNPTRKLLVNPNCSAEILSQLINEKSVLEYSIVLIRINPLI